MDFTVRGFARVDFTDRYGVECSIQDSSLATERAIWLGVNDAKPERLEPGKGWVAYPVPDDVVLHTRMHLTQAQVAALLPLLHRFVETGSIVDG